MQNRSTALCGLSRGAFLLGSLFFCASVFAADNSGSIRGRVISVETGAAVSGVTLSAAGVTATATSDLNGDYVLRDVPAGEHDLVAEHPDFQPAHVTGVVVEDGQSARVDVPLQTSGDVVLLGAYEVSATAAAGSGLVLMGERQKAPTISDAIGEDAISRFAMGDAAGALSRMPAASVVDGKYVLIRGLGDRYSNTLLNGITVPSADPDRRAVQMDQFPASVLESIVTSKSFTPDQPGGFSGGSVNLRTKTFPDAFFVSASTSVTMNSAVTGEQILVVPGSGDDWLGIDDGTRALPEGIPNRIPSPTEAQLAARQGDFGPAQELDRVSQLFDNRTYFPHEERAGPDFGFSFATGNRHDFSGDRRLGYLFSLTYDRSTSHYTDGYAARYSQGSFNPDSTSFVDGLLVYSPDLADLSLREAYESAPDVPGGTPHFGVTDSAQKVDWGAYLQVAFMPSLNHEATLRYLHSQSAIDDVKRGVGESVRSDAGRLYENYGMLYTERSMDSLQLAGKSHFPGLNDIEIEWRAATSQSTQDQPDYRTLSYFWDFINEQYASASGVGNNRVFRKIEEENDEFGLDVSVPLQFRGRSATVKLGSDWQDGSRGYRERRFRWSREANQIDLIQNYPNPVGIVSQTERSVVFGNTISELSNRLLNYDGDQAIGGSYLMADLPLSERWRTIFGLRAERTEISTSAVTEGASFRAADIDQTDYLPALTVVYAATDNVNLRAAYGRTIARPLYRELADVRIDDFFRDSYFIGNPDLEVSTVDNFDLRWEWFLNGSGILAVGAFYKEFERPIEILLDGRSGAEQPRNLDEGRAYGLEFEARIGLGRLSPALEPFSLGGNFSLIESEVSIPAAELATTRQVFPDAPDTRELFGQSPYVLNLDLRYTNSRIGTDATLAFNMVGERLALVTADALPEIYEQPAPQLDLVVSQRLWANWRLKLAARNLLDPAIEKSFSHAGVDYFYERYKRGRSFSLGLSYLFE